jgi:hypothetical protein
MQINKQQFPSEFKNLKKYKTQAFMDSIVVPPEQLHKTLFTVDF